MIKSEIQKSKYPIPPELMDVIPGYIGRREQDIQALKAAVEIKDFIKIEQIAHKLKGNGASFGFDKLTEIGINLMSSSHQQNSFEIEKLVLVFETEINLIKASIG